MCSRMPSLVARVVRSVPLLYDDGANKELDRPAHVRAGSSLLQLSSDRLAVVQDDANFVAVVHLDTMHVSSVALPADVSGKRLFDERRGTKKEKMDLEAGVVDDDGRLILFGSGSSSAREKISIVVLGDERQNAGNAQDAVFVVRLHSLYSTLRHLTAFCGPDLNIEGATRINKVLRLFNRNNGESKEGVAPVNASCDLDWDAFMSHLSGSKEIPIPFNVCQYDLGTLEGVKVGFTDATTVDHTHIFFSGAAEDSPNAILDGPVSGSVIGVHRADGFCGWALVTSQDGSSFSGKIEGLVVQSGGRQGYAIVDRDSIDVPSELLVLELEGFV